MQKSPRRKSGTFSDLLSSINHISDVRFSPDGENIFYRTSHDGTGVIYVLDQKGNSRIISSPINAGGTVGYGGGAFDVSKGLIIACDKSGDLYKIEVSQYFPISRFVPCPYRTCSPKISPDEKWVVFIYDQEETSGIGISSLNGYSLPRQLVLGADFYMQPAWHPNGKMIAWAEWDHPHMPWDASRIKVGNVGGMQVRLFDEQYIDGDVHSAANQPKFSPDGKWLSYIKRKWDWDELILYDLEKHNKKAVIHGEVFHIRMPDWIQGLHSYEWSGDSKDISFIQYSHGSASLSRVNIHTSEIEHLNILPYIWASQVDISHKTGEVIFLGSSTSEANQIVSLAGKSKVSGLISTQSLEESPPVPEEIIFNTKDNFSVHAWYFPPTVKSGKKGPPPCVINIHSGPTSVKHVGFSVNTALLTARGFSVAYLNYRGSVSFGYHYQEALRRKWGEAEIEDFYLLLKELVNCGLADPKSIAAMGSSAGGFSVLNILIKYPGLIQAGICSYPVSDLVDDALHTHKFERYYHQFLTGDFSKERERFIDRSPASHLEKIKDPLLLFHGDEDKVVSVQQSRKIYDALTDQKTPCILKIYEGEGHGFRKQENIEDFYQTVCEFLDSNT